MNADPCLGTAKTQGVTHGRFQRYRRIRLMDKQKVGPPKGARPIGGHGTPHPPVRQAPSGRTLALGDLSTPERMVLLGYRGGTTPTADNRRQEQCRENRGEDDGD